VALYALVFLQAKSCIIAKYDWEKGRFSSFFLWSWCGVFRGLLEEMWYVLTGGKSIESFLNKGFPGDISVSFGLSRWLMSRRLGELLEAITMERIGILGCLEGSGCLEFYSTWNS